MEPLHFLLFASILHQGLVEPDNWHLVGHCQQCNLMFLLRLPPIFLIQFIYDYLIFLIMYLYDSLAEALDLQPPVMPDDGHTTRVTTGADASSVSGKESSVPEPIWDDEDTRAFYEFLPDLRFVGGV